MGRLIDAEQTKLMLSELLEIAKKEGFTAEDAIEHACVWIDNQPTAYDVEKVVKQLEEVKEAVSGCFGIMCSECKYTGKCYTGEMAYKVSIDKSIDIVKRGGVE